MGIRTETQPVDMKVKTEFRGASSVFYCYPKLPN